MKRILVLALVIVPPACSSDVTPPDDGPNTISVAFSTGTLSAELATTSEQRTTGLSNRASLSANAGMLFVFGLDRLPNGEGFWMKNTSIPLSIAFIDSARRVINIEDMAPFDTVNIHRSTGQYRYSLEVNQGWFAQHGVAAGAVASFTIPPGTVISP